MATWGSPTTPWASGRSKQQPSPLGLLRDLLLLPPSGPAKFPPPRGAGWCSSPGQAAGEGGPPKLPGPGAGLPVGASPRPGLSFFLFPIAFGTSCRARNFLKSLPRREGKAGSQMGLKVEPCPTEGPGASVPRRQMMRDARAEGPRQVPLPSPASPAPRLSLGRPRPR